MSYDLSIQGRVYGDGKTKGFLYVRKGKIAKVSREPAGRSSAEVRLLDTQFLMPAATDLHVHLRDWEQSQKETVETGTKSALAGGVTTVADMPNTVPRVDSAETVGERVSLLRTKSFVDFAVHSGPPDSAAELRKVRKAGAFAIKLYPPELSRFHDLLRPAFRSGLKIAVHAEDPSLIETPEAGAAEGVAVRKLLGEMRRESRVRFAHISTYDGASQVVRAKKSHRGISVEVTPHHLFVSSEEAERRIGPARRVNPSLRSSANCSRLRGRARAGDLDFYATDHAPHTVEEKFEGAPGFPALEFALPLFLTKTDDIGLVSRMYCAAPAAYLGVAKGRIARGYIADLVVVGRRRWKIDPEQFVSKGRVTPFAGETMRYSVDHVFKGGTTVYDSGRFTKTRASLVTDRESS